MSALRCVITLLCMCWLAGCAVSSTNSIRSGTTKAVVTTESLKAPDTTAADGAYIGASEYRIGSQDLLEIAVFQVADLDRTVRVNSDGQISLPLVGSVLAGGKTVQELEQAIASKLREGFLQDPQVSVFVQEFASQRITLEGAVKNPGIYALKGRTSLLQAIAMAQGVSDLARLDGVVVFRTIEGQKMAALFDLREIRGGNVPDPLVYGDDIIVVDQSESRTAIRRIVESIPVFNLFNPY